MKILVVRFRQMGDAILATPLLSTLRANFPDAEIDYVLNERIAPLFDGHPALSRIITFTDEERHSFFTYIRKVWRTVHQTRYDAIIDMRSTTNTMLFALFSLHSRWRIGIRKPYTWGIFNYRFEGCEDDESMISHNLRLATPLLTSLLRRDQREGVRNLSLSITEEEKHEFRQYMQQQGIDFSRPVVLVGVTAKLASKTWPEDRMVEVLRRFMAAWPAAQLIFNYAPGQEAVNARRIYQSLEVPLNGGSVEKEGCAGHFPSFGEIRGECFINIEAKSMRQLASMAANCTFYFGNEGGARHIVHAMGRPSFVICSPGASKTTWLPQDTDIPAEGIAATDLVADPSALAGLTSQQQYALITVDAVWPRLKTFAEKLIPNHKD